MPEILVIDDNAEILSANESYLTREGFTVTAAQTGVVALSLISSRRFDCIILDILLPDLDGYAVCKAARTVTDTPILFLSCLDELDEKLKGLMIGGDDYMTKPYSLRELSARVRVLLRRGRPKEDPVKNDGFYVDLDKRIIHTKKQSVLLSKKEFELFMLFYDNPGVVFSKEAILGEIWQKGEVNPHAVTVHITNLRKKISFAEPQLGRIESKYGNGYLLIPPTAETKSRE
ncbi:DNA-binding response regulator [Synergistales bacterium]|nr:DNA-binding response regulator [Synergistales bacterium]